MQCIGINNCKFKRFLRGGDAICMYAAAASGGCLCKEAEAEGRARVMKDLQAMSPAARASLAERAGIYESGVLAEEVTFAVEDPYCGQHMLYFKGGNMNKNTWTPVTTEPTEEGDYLARTPSRMVVAFWSERGWRATVGPITHWMPLPLEPEESEEEAAFEALKRRVHEAVETAMNGHRSNG